MEWKPFLPIHQKIKTERELKRGNPNRFLFVIIHMVSLVFPWVILFQRINLSNDRLFMLNMLIISITMKIMETIGVNRPVVAATGRDLCKRILQKILMIRLPIVINQKHNSINHLVNNTMHNIWPIEINGKESKQIDMIKKNRISS